MTEAPHRRGATLWRSYGSDLGLRSLASVLPRPGPVWGPYPQRPDTERAPMTRGLRWRMPLAQARQVVHACQLFKANGPVADLELAAASTGAALRREGLQGPALSRALALAAWSAERTLGIVPRPCQLVAAATMLDNRFAEMATGEGKTLAIAIGAAVAALAGMPVHVVTANEYLAQRDARQMQPLFAALGLSACALSAGQEPQQRREAYAQPIVYATAKDLAFDYLRDRLEQKRTTALERAVAGLGAESGTPPLMQGLCMALLDEADSILLDEAEVPLILSRAAPHAARRAFLWQALSIARSMAMDRHFRLATADRRVSLTAAGESWLEQAARDLGGPWRRQRYRQEAITMALAALHLYLRDVHYLVRDAQIELVDEVTGRVAAGRVWSHGLHTLVALKEGVAPPPDTEVAAQTTFQRLFQRYWRLAGLSGTLREAGAELRRVYGGGVVRIPLHQPGRRVEWPQRRFRDTDSLFAAVVGRVRDLQRAGRPVLIGTDDVADAQRLSTLLHTAQIEHQLLDARHDAAEAAIVAQAGRSGTVTVATRMAGRGTDIELDPRARAAGGLHVLCCQHNPSRRQDRQLAGRAGRQGDPGSVEHWRADSRTGAWLQGSATGRRAWNWAAARPGLRKLVQWLGQWPQRAEERRRALLRGSLVEQDERWERRLSFAGRAD